MLDGAGTVLVLWPDTPKCLHIRRTRTEGAARDAHFAFARTFTNAWGKVAWHLDDAWREASKELPEDERSRIITALDEAAEEWAAHDQPERVTRLFGEGSGQGGYGERCLALKHFRRTTQSAAD